MAHAERRIAKLVLNWMTWLKCKHVGPPPPAIRIDVLVKRIGPGRADVHTLELTELGFSMLSWRDGPSIVFHSLLASCFDDIGPNAKEQSLLCEAEDRYRKQAYPNGLGKQDMGPPFARAAIGNTGYNASSSDGEESSTGGGDTGGGQEGGAIAELRRDVMANANMAV